MFFGTFRHGTAVKEHMCGSWAEFTAFSKTQGFVAGFHTDRIIQRNDFTMKLLECLLENFVHFRFEFNVLEFEWLNFNFNLIFF